MERNRITQLLGMQLPIIQGGMVWCSGWRLASAVSNAGGLGLLGAGSMSPEVLKLHIQHCKSSTTNPFGVNVPLLYSGVGELINVIRDEGIKIVFTSAGNPSLYTQQLKADGIKVVHVVSSLKFALKAQEAGVDAIVAEGVEAGGHNGREETTTFCLLPLIVPQVQIPVIAAGGIATGRALLAARVLGADAGQVGTRFAVCEESSAHLAFKQCIRLAQEGDTELVLKMLGPVRLFKNEFYKKIKQGEAERYSVLDWKELVGKGRSRKGIFEGDLEEGMLEIGQVSATVHQNEHAAQVVKSIWEEYLEAISSAQTFLKQ